MRAGDDPLVLQRRKAHEWFILFHISGAKGNSVIHIDMTMLLGFTEIPLLGLVFFVSEQSTPAKAADMNSRIHNTKYSQAIKITKVSKVDSVLLSLVSMNSQNGEKRCVELKAQCIS